MPRDNEVGAIWQKSNERGEYLSISLDLEALLALTGGSVGKVNITAYPIEGPKTNPNAPDLRLMFYPRGSGKPAAPRTAQPRVPGLEDPDDPLP